MNQTVPPFYVPGTLKVFFNKALDNPFYRARDGQATYMKWGSELHLPYSMKFQIIFMNGVDDESLDWAMREVRQDVDAILNAAFSKLNNLSKELFFKHMAALEPAESRLNRIKRIVSHHVSFLQKDKGYYDTKYWITL